MDVSTVRRVNPQRLVDQEGSLKAFASKVGTDPAYVSALLSANIGRNPGTQFMRRVEKAYTLPAGSLDFPEETSMAAAMALQVLPEADRAQAFDYIRYKIEGARALVANQQIADAYLELVGRLGVKTAGRDGKTKG